MKVKILSLTLTCLLMLCLVLYGKEKIHVNFWQELFTDSIETAYIIMKDGTIFEHTSYYDKKVYMSIGRLEEALKKFNKNYSIKDIGIFIHNHFKRCGFSDEDRKQYRMLKKYEFNGLFLLYCHRTNKTYPMEEKKK